MKARGFTIVELLIVMIVIVIILTLSVVNVRATQVKARDAERIADVESIAAVMESYRETSTPTGGNMYMSTDDFAGSGNTYLRDRLDKKSLYAPNVDTSGPISLVVAQNVTEVPTDVLPAPTISTYIYQPISTYNILCASVSVSNCRKFNIYYKLEAPTDNCPAPDNICVLRSTFQ